MGYVMIEQEPTLDGGARGDPAEHTLLRGQHLPQQQSSSSSSTGDEREEGGGGGSSVRGWQWGMRGGRWN